MGRIFNQKEWLEELDETGPEKRRKASNYKRKTKLLDNGSGSETSTARESSLHADVGQTSWNKRFWNDNTTKGFCARIVDVCLFQVVISRCCCKLTHTDICQCVIKFWHMMGFLTPNHINLSLGDSRHWCYGFSMSTGCCLVRTVICNFRISNNSHNHWIHLTDKLKETQLPDLKNCRVVIFVWFQFRRVKTLVMGFQYQQVRVSLGQWFAILESKTSLNH